MSSFPSDSSWGKQRAIQEELRSRRMGAFPAVPDEPQSAPMTVAIPYPVLEDWINGLELAGNGDDVQGILDEMRSYFRG